MKTSTIILIVVGVAVAGAIAYFALNRQKMAPPLLPVSPAQTQAQSTVGFIKDQGKKVLSQSLDFGLNKLFNN